MTRTGKVARLPTKVREELNSRLLEGEPGRALVKWLNGLPEVQSVLREHFEGRVINEQNLSEWKRGGFVDWSNKGEAVEVMERIHEEADDLNELCKRPYVEELGLWLTARYSVTMMKIFKSRQIEWKQLRHMCKDVNALRRADHQREMLKLIREQMELNQEKAKRKGKRNPLPTEAEILQKLLAME